MNSVAYLFCFIDSLFVYAKGEWLYNISHQHSQCWEAENNISLNL